MSSIKRALISVSDKTGLVDLVKGLHQMKVEIISTGGTARAILETGVPVKEISSFTGFPEIMNGRVKTLHPKVHGGLLGIRNNPEHRRQMEENGIEPIDLVVVNLYPFEATAAKGGVSFEEIIENIDIGGPSMVRSAAKNFQDVAIVVSPSDYPEVMKEMASTSGLSLSTRFRLARKAFELTAKYDSTIAACLAQVQSEQDHFSLEREDFPPKFYMVLQKVTDLRYGENPHQKAAFYREASNFDALLPDAVQLQGKELSFNNLIDLNAAYNLAFDFEVPCAAIIKHTNPCGVALSATSQVEAYRRARECDPVSAFGSVLGFNQPLDEETAGEIATTFVEAIIAPDYAPESLKLLSSKKNLRLLKTGNSRRNLHPWDYKRVEGGLLIQEVDRLVEDEASWKVVSQRGPTEEEMEGLRFSWKVVKHVKSNAIVYANRLQTVGVGAGQMSRVDSARIGISKAILPIQGCVMASDAFFPFRDGIDVAASAGITAVIQPGGSVRDPEVIQAANEHGMAMVLTGLRHFKH